MPSVFQWPLFCDGRQTGNDQNSEFDLLIKARNICQRFLYIFNRPAPRRASARTAATPTCLALAETAKAPRKCYQV